ncbi:MAG: RNA methyltransferase [Bacteroidetes bacterium]|jgi:tRNA (guanosine-2'-O-)-methyltransferase|nr:RNA methyltransferase [Bacteroidota bacterium]MBT3750813.1 RNA methyltransferase [Bacteroidota bacterium]MBT4399869.1 RNA methyltransferase [Bacteroidota bacterium]MBT5426762.1 RNA methyltransferase [Bacteroidota bacterium]MBT7465057.1 RNA methyltransferase [Bacteroidota bacterium]
MKNLLEHLSEFVLPRRLELFEEVLAKRSKYITVALEDIYQSQNASAVLRTCECLGVQDVHIIEDRNQYKLNPDVVMGSTKWLSMYRYNLSNSKTPTLEAINQLRTKGYRIVATTPHKDDVELQNLDLTKGKIALFFGTELTGLSKTMLDNADEFVKISMHGFTESFNISVSAAITLHHLRQKLENSGIMWQLSKEEKDELKLSWLKQSIKKADLIEEQFFGTK